jgi:hypothetical protein
LTPKKTIKLGKQKSKLLQNICDDIYGEFHKIPQKKAHPDDKVNQSLESLDRNKQSKRVYNLTGPGVKQLVVF